MTSTNFRQVNNQAIAAPFWANMEYDSVNSLFFELFCFLLAFSSHRMSRRFQSIGLVQQMEVSIAV